MIREFTSAELLFIVGAIRWTLILSAIAFLGGAIGGLGIALARTSQGRALRRGRLASSRSFRARPC